MDLLLIPVGPGVEKVVMAMPVWERVGGGSDREHVDRRHQHEREPEGAEGQHDSDEDHQHVAPDQDSQARRVVVLVEVV